MSYERFISYQFLDELPETIANVDYAICTFGTNSQDPLQETDLEYCVQDRETVCYGGCWIALG